MAVFYETRMVGFGIAASHDNGRKPLRTMAETESRIAGNERIALTRRLLGGFALPNSQRLKERAVGKIDATILGAKGVDAVGCYGET
jgi:hypothetical protein